MDKQWQRIAKHLTHIRIGSPVLIKSTADKLDEYLSRIEALEAENARLREIEVESRFLVDRLVEYEADCCQCEESVREWNGHVTPPLARLQSMFWNDDSRARAALKQEGGE